MLKNLAKYQIFSTLNAILTLTNLFLPKMSKIPDYSGFWEFPKVSKLVPIHVPKSQELGLFPKSSHTNPILELNLCIDVQQPIFEIS